MFYVSTVSMLYSLQKKRKTIYLHNQRRIRNKMPCRHLLPAWFSLHARVHPCNYDMRDVEPIPTSATSAVPQTGGISCVSDTRTLRYDTMHGCNARGQRTVGEVRDHFFHRLEKQVRHSTIQSRREEVVLDGLSQRRATARLGDCHRVVAEEHDRDSHRSTCLVVVTTAGQGGELANLHITTSPG